MSLPTMSLSIMSLLYVTANYEYVIANYLTAKFSLPIIS